MELTITKANFDTEVMNADTPVLLDFWATWCGPCRMLAPILEELEVAYDGKLVVGKVDVDEESELAAQFHISSIPTVVLIKNGQILESSVGFRSKADLEAMIQNVL